MGEARRDQNVFFKYRPIGAQSAKKRLRDYFCRNELWYAQPGCLNDPFDCFPCVTVGGEPHEHASREFFKQIHERTAILSMSQNPLSTQQWSYYAEDHRGVCIGFNMRHAGSEEKYEVEYHSERPVIPHELLVAEDDREGRVKLMMKGITSKALNWRHEQEYRFLKMASAAYPFPPMHLVSVYFGYRCRETDIDYMERLIDRSECEPHCAIMLPSLEDYTMRIHFEDDFRYLRELARAIRAGTL